MQTITTTLLLCFAFSLHAQICYDLSSPTGLMLQVDLIADRDYNAPFNSFSTGAFTISWDQSLGEDVIQSINTPSGFPYTYDPQGAPNPFLVAGKYYQKFGFSQSVTFSFQDGVPLTILTIEVESSMATSGVFEIIPNPPDEVNGDISILGLIQEEYQNHGCNLIVNNVSLPLDFLSFSATPCDISSCLSWSTANEEGVSHFNVLRLNGTRWDKVGEEEATNEHNASYALKDDLVLPGQTYIYQVVGIDYDGTETISEKRSVSFDGEPKINVYPNPSVDQVTIHAPQESQLTIFDIHGKLVYSSTIGISPMIKLDCSTWLPGLYTVILEDTVGNNIGKGQIVKQ